MPSGMSNANQPAPHHSLPQQPAKPPWLWLLLILGFGLVFWLYAPAKPPGANPPPTAHFPIFLLTLGAVCLYVCVMIAVAFFRSYDSGVRRAVKRAGTGDLAGAIEDIRQQIEVKGPTQNRVNTLGLFLLKHESWAEAAASFRKAAELGAAKGVCQANLGLALLKDGKPAEALPILEEASRIGPNDPVFRSLVFLHISLALAELGRWEKALEHFRVAEEIAAGLGKAQRAALAKSLDEGRRKLEQPPRDSRKP